MYTYETLFITKPDLTEEDEQAAVDGFAALVTDGGGTMIANERVGRRRLAYPIEKIEEGVYTRFLYDSDSPVPQEIERRFRLSDQVLRSLTVRLRDEWAEDSKKQAILDAERRVQEAIDAKAKAEADALEAEAKAIEEAEAAEAAAAAEAAGPEAAAEAAEGSADEAPTTEAAEADGEATASEAADAKPEESTEDTQPADGTDEVR